MPEFVASEGLSCFIKVGAEADHNYQNYILRGETAHRGLSVRNESSWPPGDQQTPGPFFLFAISVMSAGKSSLWLRGELQGFFVLCFYLLSPVCVFVCVWVCSALSQIMLFVDGMNGVIRHAETLQWLYTLTGSLVRTTLTIRTIIIYHTIYIIKIMSLLWTHFDLLTVCVRSLDWW